MLSSSVSDHIPKVTSIAGAANISLSLEPSMVTLVTPIQLKHLKRSTLDGIANKLTKSSVTDMSRVGHANDHTYAVFKTTSATTKNIPTTAKPTMVNQNVTPPEQALNVSVKPTTPSPRTIAQLSTGTVKFNLMII